MPYAPPVAEMRFALDVVAGVDRLATLDGLTALSSDLIDDVLVQGGRFAADVLAPLNMIGDRTGATLENGVVRVPDGFQQAYGRFVEAGWNSVPFGPDYGGQDLPWTLSFALSEMWQSANMSFGLCPLLTQGAVELLSHHGSLEQKTTYLPPLIAGNWTGTMNLTEPQAGSDVGAVRTRATREGEHYRIKGQKIFITYGDHDLADNIIHMVLARTAGAPPGPKGISLFIVPKFLVEPDGSIGRRNDLRCLSLEHKLGIHASPTCVMSFGDNEGAMGWLVGEENSGLEYMFTMMNNARLSVGLQGVSIAERAYQQARDFARQRIQSREIGSRATEAVPIIRHPDVRRMLAGMRARIEAARALLYSSALSLDEAIRHPDPARRTSAQARVDLLTPVCKAWATDLGVEVASTGIQIHGGVGYIEETGAAQHLRDARIAPIYEGTNGIQANDLVFRKLARDKGAAADAYFAEIADTISQLQEQPGDDAPAIAGELDVALNNLRTATRWMLDTIATDPATAAAGATPYLQLFGLVAGGHMMARTALVALDRLATGPVAAEFLNGRLLTALAYAGQVLPAARGLIQPITDVRRTVLAMPVDGF